MTERSAKVISISNYGDLNLEGNPRPGFPTPTRQLSLAYVTIPRLNRTGDEIGAFQAREFLRKTLVGKQITFTVSYTIPTTQKEFGQIRYNGQDVAELMLRQGLISFRTESSKREDASSATLETYQICEAQARSENKGLWAEAPKKIVAEYDNPDIKSFLNQYRGRTIDAIVEQVRAGDLLRVRLVVEPERHQYANLLVAGIKAPASARTGADGMIEAAEEHGEQAKAFVETRLLQRSVQVVLLGANQNLTGFVATILHPAGNIAEALLSAGLARVVDYHSTMLGESMSKLRTAESSAKQSRLNIWKGHVPKKSTNTSASEATISRVLSADTLLVRSKDGHEKRLQMSSIRGPKSSDTKQAAFAGEAKEFLRKKSIGKHVQVTIDFTKPAADGYDEKTLATITLGKDNLAKVMVERGYASVIRHRRDDEDRSPVWDDLLAAEELAISEQKGIHSTKVPVAPGRIVEASENATRAKTYLSTLQRAKRVAGVIEFVASGGRFKIFVPRENAKLTFVLSGIRVPRTARNASETSEPLGEASAEYATKKLMQRDIEIEVETTDRVGGFVGTLYLAKENFAASLLEEGLASVHEYAAEQSGHATLYREAEARAKSAKKGIWEKYDPSTEQDDTPEREMAESVSVTNSTPREYLDLVVTDVNSATGAFSYQIVGDGVKLLEKLMGELQSTYAKSVAAVSQPPKVGDNVAARFSEDNAWYRGKVKRVDRSSSQAEILYYDYGNTELVSFKDLSSLAPKFCALTPQAKEAKLSFLELSASEEYLEDAISWFQSRCQKQLVACIDHRAGSNIFLSLYDPTNQDPNETINLEMIKEGWATVLPSKKLTWEKSHEATLSALRQAQSEAQRRHRGMFEFGDSTGYDE